MSPEGLTSPTAGQQVRKLRTDERSGLTRLEGFPILARRRGAHQIAILRATRRVHDLAPTKETAMHAMMLNTLRTPLVWTEAPDRRPGPGQIRIQVLACGVCRTDLHVVDGELPDPLTPIIPGHEIVGRIDAMGAGVEGLTMGERVGVPLARPYLRRLSLLPYEPRKPVRPSGLHRLHARRRICDFDDSRRPLRFPARGGRRRRIAGALVVRGLDRLAVAENRRGRKAAWPLRLRRCGAYCRASRQRAGAIRIRLLPGPETLALRPSPGVSGPSGPAAPTKRRPNRLTPRSFSHRLAASCLSR